MGPNKLHITKELRRENTENKQVHETIVLLMVHCILLSKLGEKC
uniref:Uncharacterized protein n=1 Tax=Arundo donax TaxID=35708 RepID=A0A0A9BN11_ARUDO